MRTKQKITPREKILTLLEAAGTWVSGEGISRELGISRAAVSKHVGALRSEGHAIEAATRNGYKLLARHYAVDAKALAASLDTRVFGKAGWTLLQTTASTNIEAARLAEEGAREGHVIVAERQSKGRGRKGHEWVSAPRGLQFSVLLYPEASRWNAQAFMRLGAQAVAAAIAECSGLEAVFKMPNDVLVNGKKVAGVLAEAGFRGDEPEWAVIGVGCNVHMLLDDFPEALRQTATSLLLEGGLSVERGALLARMLEKLERAYEEQREE